MRYSAPVSILLADNRIILAYGPDCVNIEMLVEGKWCPGYLEDVWCVPSVGRHLFWVMSAAEHGISVVMKHHQIMFQCDSQLVATGQWMTDACSSILLHNRLLSLPPGPCVDTWPCGNASS
jgi:hypothetical protein